MQGTGLIIFPLLIFYKNVIKKKKKKLILLIRLKIANHDLESIEVSI